MLLLSYCASHLLHSRKHGLPFGVGTAALYSHDVDAQGQLVWSAAEPTRRSAGGAAGRAVGAVGAVVRVGEGVSENFEIKWNAQEVAEQTCKTYNRRQIADLAIELKNPTFHKGATCAGCF